MSGSDDEYSFDDATYGRVGSGTTTPSVTYVNESGIRDDDILSDRKFQAEVASVIEKWSQSLDPGRSAPSLDVFSRSKWKSAKHPFAIMSQCAWAVENDDILSTLADVCEGLAFKKMRFELNDEDQQDVWNQWAREVNLDARLREMFREEFKTSQVYIGLWWEQRIYKIRDNPLRDTLDKIAAAEQQAGGAAADGTGDGTDGTDSFTSPPRRGPGRGNRKRKKNFAVTVPTAMTIFDPLKIMPVGSLMFNRERFVYIADRYEHDAFTQAMAGEIIDGTVMQLVERKYDPTPADILACQEMGIDQGRLWLLKSGAVFRHTRTRAQYERFAPIRLKAVLEILDLKQHQRASDRAALIGNTNFIVVITKGSDKLPARAPEIENLKEQARMIARLPVLVGDHRLEVKIVTPPLDHTLQESRWQVLDSRLVFKALQSFQPIVQGGNSSSGVSEMGRVVSQGLENRRHMLVRSVEQYILLEIVKRNDGVLTEDPSLTFAPKRVTLDFNQDIMNAILKLRDRGDISRETSLDEFDYDQDTEVVRRAREKEVYDPVFQSATPHSSPGANPYNGDQSPASDQPPQQQQGQPPSVTGARGGRPKGVAETKPRQPAGTVKS